MSGKTIKTKATELTDADVRYISLVPRGANRIPFRVQKKQQESDMGIDLGGLFKTKKHEVTTPTVSALVIPSKGENFAEVTAAIKAAGYSVENIVENADGTVIFKQDESPEDGAVAIRMSDSLAIALKGFRPYAEALSNSFKEQAAANGFYSGMRNACDTLTNVVSTGLYDADSPSDAVDVVKKTVKEFGEYLVALAQALPATAFKADKALGELAVKAEQKREAAVKAEADKQAALKAEEAAKTTVAKTDAKEPNEQPKTDAQAPAVNLDELVQKAAAGAAAAMKAQMDEVLTTVKTLGEQVAAVVVKADNADKVLKSVVPSQPNGEDQPARTSTQTVAKKSDPRTGVFDTAFMPNNGRPQ